MNKRGWWDRWGTIGRTMRWQARFTLHLRRTKAKTLCGLPIFIFHVPRDPRIERVCGSCARIRRAELAATEPEGA